MRANVPVSNVPPSRRCRAPAALGTVILAVAAAGIGACVSGSAARPDDVAAVGDTPLPAEPPRPAAPGGDDTRTWIEMRNVALRVADDAAVGVRMLRGEVVATRAGEVPLLDSASSFSIRVTAATVALRGEDLSVILNRFVFGYRGSPLRNLKVRTSGTQLVQSGIMHKGVDLPFEITATPSITDSGLIRLHPTRVRVLGINGLAFLRALGLQLDDLLDLSGSRAAIARGDDIYLDPTKILPPPAIDGRVRSVRVEGNELVQEFARLPEDSVFERYARPDTSAANFVYFRGSRLRFGRLEMRDTDLLIVDVDPADPFDLFLERFNRQLVAGYSRTMPHLGLRAFFPDYRDMKEQAAVAGGPEP